MGVGEVVGMCVCVEMEIFKIDRHETVVVTRTVKTRMGTQYSSSSTFSRELVSLTGRPELNNVVIHTALDGASCNVHLYACLTSCVTHFCILTLPTC